jgi:UDP-glucose 4-epimerase
VILRYANPSGCHPSGLIGENPLEAANLMPVVSLVLQGRREAVEVYGTDFDTIDGTGKCSSPIRSQRSDLTPFRRPRLHSRP